MKNSHTGANVGGITILVVFLVLCLSVFSVLSVASANADLKITNRALASVADYYEADARAQFLLSEIDAGLKAAGISSAAGYLGLAYDELLDTLLAAGVDFSLEEKEDSLSLSFQVPVGESRAIFAELSVPAAEKGRRFEVLSWRAAAPSGEEYGEAELDLWGGGAVIVE